MDDQPESVVNSFLCRKCLRNVGSQQDQVRPFPIAVGILSLHALPEESAKIVFGPEFVNLFVS